VVFIAAAGNANANAANFFPASFATAIGVMAMDANDARATFSNYGDRMDVCAPGVDILSTRATNSNLGPLVGTSYMRLNGTSMAAPHAAGVAALVLSLHPEFSVEQIRQVLRVSASDLGTAGPDSFFGYGRVNASNALTIASALEARILSPESEVVTSDLVSIDGVAQGPEFNQFTVDYGSGDSPSSWTVLNQSAVPVAGALGSFDARNLPDGRYTIRLRVFDSQGRQYEDRIKIAVNLVVIASPAPPVARGLAYEFKPGVVVPIVGTATSATFQNYQLQWARGYYATSGWSSANITLTGNGSQPLTNEVLGQWNTAGLTNADVYTVRLTVQSAGFSVAESTVVYLEPDLLSPNWPKRLDIGADLDNSVVPQTDAAGDIWFRVLATDITGTPIVTRLWNFAADGSITVTQSISAAAYRQPPAGPFDGQLGDELIVGEQSNLRAFQTDGPGYAFPYPSIPWSQRSIRVMDDVDGDGSMELLFVSIYQGNAYLYAWKTNGTALTTNYPVSFPEAHADIQYYGQNRVLTVDLDHDGKKEILAVAAASGGYTVRAYNWDGTVRSWPSQVQSGRFSHWAAADFDRDGLPEIVISYIDYSGNAAKVAVFDGTGALKPGWPVALPQPANSEKGFLAIGDLDRNGVDEIVIAAENVLHVLKADGTSFGAAWPFTTGLHGQPILADVNNDGYPDILTVTDDADYYTVLRAYDRTGTLLKSWPLLGFEGIVGYYRATPVAGDFNHDGRTDIAVLCPLLFPSGLLNGNGLTVLSTTASFTPDAVPWAMNMHDPQNLSVRLLPPEQVPPAVGISSPANNAVVSNAVTISAAATDNIRVAGVKFFADGSLIGTEDTTSPFSIAWDSTTVAVGLHTLTAVARDPAGNTSTSAPVVVRVRNTIRINFQPEAAPVPTNYLVDAGLVFGPRGNPYSYGWNSNNVANVFDRNSSLSADQRYDTLATMQVGGSFNWEIALSSGSYRVRIVAGDPDNFNSVYKINAETVQVINFTPKSGNRWKDNTSNVTVSDGRLTVSNATGASNNKICFLEITPLP
jgi:hypothetical protein